ncbi:TetR/AcrR family transcriptional regulator [Bradyrhizobium pachyrhizi]|uniref:TetR/AcrR family transcriptional regulator n=1 Tax=Bradyrhizobium TaxID=374 RepID=UPI00041517A9|nr:MULTISPECIES: TetR/AcrR family transcriptional regulator [Bradyrhizobium]WFU58479.1 TetR/AcrR family transcriptional regulator [Bradyrhizobium pachyrhizi]WOH83799.1 TetR/AcrR family transcriptional regulator [Bradyrhizobium sp. BEA-2-5]
MGHSQAEKARSRERILNEAATQIRGKGLDALSIGGLMQQVKLTHGGFYGHFASRSDLIAAALEQALDAGEASAHAARDPDKPININTLVRSYLSRAHRDSPGSGCAIGALISDVGRADAQCRAVMEPHIESFIAKVAETFGDDDDGNAILAVSAMVGALAISRVLTDQKRSDAVLRTVRDSIVAMASDE